MKRYDTYLFSVIAFIILALVHQWSAEARSLAPKMSCTKEKSFWLRHACKGGFVTIRKNKVVAQHDGLDLHDRQVEIVKETCRHLNSKLFDRIQIRLFSPSAEKYICFTKAGKIRPMNPRQAIGKGKLCLFYEEPVLEPSLSSSGSGGASLFVNLQSVYNESWYLGFGPQKPGQNKHKGVTLMPDGYEVLLPRQMSKQSPHPVRNSKCDFRFMTGAYSPRNDHQEWSGLFQHILENAENKMSKAEKRFEEKVFSLEKNFISKDERSKDDREEILGNKLSKQKPYDRFDDENSLMNEPPPLPSPLALRRQKTFRRKPSQPSYFFDHNRRRSGKVSESLSELDSRKPLFSSFR